MKAIESIKVALEYIETHLTEDINIKEIAESGFLSPFYFQRLFHSMTGYSVSKYLMMRRLEYATVLLGNDIKVKDAAIRSGFKSVEHFSRVFKGTYDMTPSAYLKEKPVMYHVYKPDVILKNSKLDLGDKYVSKNLLLEIRIEEHQEIKLVGIDKECSFGIDTPGRDNPAVIWNEFHREKDKIQNVREPWREFGITHDYKENGFNYMAAREVNNSSDIPEGMKEFLLPKGRYVCCVYENNSFQDAVGENLKNVMDYMYKWITEENNYEIESYYAIECYTERSFKDSFELEVWVNIK